MAKRFTDTNKWRKGLLRNLPVDMKLVWLYVIDECDHAGVWDVEWDVLQVRTGIDTIREEAEKVLGDKIIIFDDGKKWFLTDFIPFQYGSLQPSNRFHKSILDLLEKYENKGLTRGLQGAKDIYIYKDNKEGGVGETKEPVTYPEPEESFFPNVEDWTQSVISNSDPVWEGMLLKENASRKTPIEVRQDWIKAHESKAGRENWNFKKQQDFRNSLMTFLKNCNENEKKFTQPNGKQPEVMVYTPPKKREPESDLSSIISNHKEKSVKELIEEDKAKLEANENFIPRLGAKKLDYLRQTSQVQISDTERDEAFSQAKENRITELQSSPDMSNRNKLRDYKSGVMTPEEKEIVMVIAKERLYLKWLRKIVGQDTPVKPDSILLTPDEINDSIGKCL